MTVTAVLPFWERAHIPIQKRDRAQEKIIRLHKDWKALQKNEKRRTKRQEEKEEKFVESMTGLFDIAHQEP